MASEQGVVNQQGLLTLTPSGRTIETGEVPNVPKVDWSKYSKRVVLRSILGRSDGGLGLVGSRVVIGGWVKSGREAHVGWLKTAPDPSPAPPSPFKDLTCVQNIQQSIPNCLRSILRLDVGGNIPLAFNNVNGVGSKQDSVVPTKSVPRVAQLQVNDGSCASSLQVVVEASITPPGQVIPIGTSILAEGVLRQSSTSSKRSIELKVEKIFHVGTVDSTKYPITKTKLPLDFLRSYSHIRPRTNTIASVTRIRNSLAYATHTFFQNHGFLYVHTPIITTSNARGTCEMFQVTNLFSEADRIEELEVVRQHEEANLKVARAAIKEKSDRIEELKRSNSNKEAWYAAEQDLKKTKQLASQMEERLKSESGTAYKLYKIDFSRDFFSRQAYLTVSGQLHLESYACALGNVYTFGPTFRAEKSESTRHLAEFWMVEPEMAFAELEDAMNCAEDYVKFLCQWLIDNCLEDMKLMSKLIDKNIFDRLRLVASSSFERITYTKAVELLKVAEKPFQSNIEWGVCLTEEHERYLSDDVYKRPIIICNHPKDIKPFYVRLNDDRRTVAAIDVIVPKVGALIRGSQREERFDIMDKRIQELGFPRDPYEWYLDLRKHGTVKHSGFSLGFEQMVLFATGLANVRDSIPFPRFCGKLGMDGAGDKRFSIRTVCLPNVCK
ncbi:asparagine--tRNA ligase, cytoplasmic 1 isoform X3 [Amborella trichopoda]|uniref:asparagine--tRNA ligase, cytoplasmic 1 isoform X3 n=1 Tax=Amborella trichopoda TaxID=13333 RepID=UPI0009C16F60|nr:asparagine--tRNA ligase, cytoplasmic 1 isoform X3 [Amborella trichopoda]|eukprot:XP_006850236.2 asparagine--tRNA ligase, cytoplasmic 1 isoform X3 [Amborella trichopoda]